MSQFTFTRVLQLNQGQPLLRLTGIWLGIPVPRHLQRKHYYRNRAKYLTKCNLHLTGICIGRQVCHLMCKQAHLPRRTLCTLHNHMCCYKKTPIRTRCGMDLRWYHCNYFRSAPSHTMRSLGLLQQLLFAL